MQHEKWSGSNQFPPREEDPGGLNIICVQLDMAIMGVFRAPPSDFGRGEEFVMLDVLEAIEGRLTGEQNRTEAEEHRVGEAPENGSVERWVLC